jgi:hypothetical protein
MNAIDTNVLVYLFDEDDVQKRVQATTTFNLLLKSPTETVTLASGLRISRLPTSLAIER